MDFGLWGGNLEIPPLFGSGPNPGRYPVVGQHLVGSLTGAVASQRVTEAPKGSLRLDGNQPERVLAQGSLTARPTSRAGTKVGQSDPLAPRGRARA